MRIVDADVKFPAGKVFDGRWGRRQNVVLESVVDGEEIKIWFGEGDARYVDLRRGDRVQLLAEKGKYTIICNDEDDETPPPAATVRQAQPAPIEKAQTRQVTRAQATTQKQAPQSDEWKAELFEAIRLRSRIIAACHCEIHKLFCNEKGELIINEETLQEYATTLYLDIKDRIK